MTGNRQPGLVLQPRDRRLLAELEVMRMIDREQAKVVAGFGSTTRANARLLALARAGLLRRGFVGAIAGGRKAVYGLSRTGAALVGAAPSPRPHGHAGERIADPFFEHRQQVNAVYLAVKFAENPVGRFRRWLSFRENLSSRIRLIPDGYFEIEADTVHPMFVEVDRGTEQLSRWKGKTEAYLQLAVSGEFERLFGYPRFRVLVLASSPRRLDTIRRKVAALTEKIFWFSTSESVSAEGFWSSIWLRPRGGERLPLLKRQLCATATNVTK